MSELAEIRATLSRLERQGGEIVGQLTGINKRLDERAADHDDLEKRTRVLEAGHNHGSGRTSVISTIMGLLGGAVAAWAARNF